ncbi:MAG: PA0069 family radical SAM protein [Planctomycetes bacterium]|nr:PA0069 family radical SAM protein [Planctomycetota bacterium]
MAIAKVSNPPNPWRTVEREWLGEPPEAELTVYEERAASILSENDSPDVGFRFSVNPYRGCFHGCAYCYARPSHQYLDFGAGTDFDRKLVVKMNAPELLEAAFEKQSWQGEQVAFSGVTDCYQPLEASYRLTRRCLEVCHKYRNPVKIITKGALIRRDAELLAALARDARLTVYISIPFADAQYARAIEPQAPSPEARFAALRALAERGIECGVAVAPLIPGLNDDQIPEVLERARAAGATRAFRILLRLPDEVRPVFEERLRAAFPLRYERVMSAMRELRGPKLYGGGFGRRMVGHGSRWRAIEDLFALACRRHGILAARELEADAEGDHASSGTTFRRPIAQGELFPDSARGEE